MSEWMFGIFAIICLSIAAILFVSLIGDFVQFLMKQSDDERRREMEKIVKEMLQQWKDSQK